MNGYAISFGPYRLLAAQRLLLEGDRRVRLGSRAFDILTALVESAGEVVGKEQLIARAWPQTFVEESNLKIQVGALRRALGDGQGGNRYIVAVPGRGYNFVAPVWREEPSRAPPSPQVAPAAMHNLPFAVTRMIGREDAVAALVSRFSRQRMVTIVGPGGIGKTTLAVAVAERLAGHYRRVCFVDLSSLRDQALVASALASALDLPTLSRKPMQSVIEFLKEQDVLLVLDNCEHVIDEAAALAAGVLVGARGVHILATSREPLRVPAESLHRLAPLDIPPASANLTAEQAFAYPAVQLFRERAWANSDAFDVTEQEVPIVVDICRRLDGIPLAIELAAATVDLFDVRGLRERLDNRFSLLTVGRPAALPRHRTLRATLDWSYEILSPREQELLRALSFFSGPFTLYGASAVAIASEPGMSDVLELVHGLVAKSLVAVDLSGSTAHLRLLDSTREYALEKLQDHGEFDTMARRHAVFYCSYLEGLEESWSSPMPPEDRAARGSQVDNIRAAIEWAFSSSGDGALGVALTVAAVPFLMHFSLIDECAVGVARVLTGDRASYARTRRQQMKLFTGLATSLLQTHVAPGASAMIAAWRSAYEIAAELNDTEYRLRTLWGLWINCYFAGDLMGALDAAERFATLAPNDTPQADLLVGERILGLTLHAMGHHANALRHIDHMLKHYVAPPDRSHLVRYQYDQKVAARSYKSLILWVQGLPEQAVRLAERNVHEADAIDHLLSLYLSLALGALPLAALVRDRSLLQRFIQRLLDISVTPTWTAWAECFRSVILIEQGDADGTHHLRDVLKERPPQLFYTWYLGVLASGLLAQGELGEARDTVQKALDDAAHKKERWCEPELLRIKAEVAAALGHRDDAGALFGQSLALAQEQGARSWELRTATSLARLLRYQGRPAEAIACLQPIYDRFTEGFGTADLIAARQLLDAQSGTGRR
jgi:predicted ATPase/DNA-binding winged helix-turn-helix (wHTH) protein